MYRFWHAVIKPVLKMINVRSAVEIGAQNGYTTKKLIDYMDIFDGEIHSIDPFPIFDYLTWEREYPHTFFMHVGLSLDILPKLPPYDAYLIDGDHNWYTVYNELNIIKRLNRDKDVLIILHDINWPYARRDLYYNPENIPEEYRNPYEKKGIKYGYRELQDDGINADLCNAIDYYTPKNGVLTAIEDFIKESEDYEFISLDCCNGLGVIKKKGSYDNVFEFLDNNKTLKNIIKQTEENRIDFFQQRYHYKIKYESALDAFNTEKQHYIEESEKCRVLELNISENEKQINDYKEQIKEYDKRIAELVGKHSGEKDLVSENIRELNSIIENLKYQMNDNQIALKEQRKSIRLLERDKEILRQQGREARKQNRDLQELMQKIYKSKKYRSMCYLEQLYHAPYKIIFLPFKVIKIIRRKIQWHNIQKKAAQSEMDSSSAVSPKTVDDTNTAAGSETKLPRIMDYDNYSIYDSRALTNTVSVVVCIHNALSDVEECLNSLWEKRTFPYEIILIDDGSEKETREYVEQFARETKCRRHRNEIAIGYTKSANIGLKMSNSDYVILLNSDTIVTNTWVEKMVDCFDKNKETGIVSPLSNAASYQSVPETRDAETGDWKINILSDSMTVDMMGLIVEKSSKQRYPKVAALNGFCFMVKRQVLNDIGYLDEENFPRGYGEEVDFCIRASKAGYDLRVVDDTYIFHEKSKSFTHQTRKELGAASKPVLKEKHGEKIYSDIGAAMADCEELSVIRKEIGEAVVSYTNKYKNLLNKKIAFLLTANGGSGGANSVCQEVIGMRSLGIDAYVINSTNYRDVFEKNYPEMVPYTEYYDKKNDESLLRIAQKYDIVIGTIFTTIKKLQLVKERYNNIKCGYYVQDYEPFFFSEGEEYFEEAKRSYTRIKDNCLFAKTEWIAKTVEKFHGVKVNIVEPSIDTRLYNPYVLKYKNIKSTVHICAMIRPKTIRRNPVGTMNVLSMLFAKYGEDIKITLFGCDDEELSQIGSYYFTFENLGILKRWEVARLLARSDIFLDMSTYQAFGRTGLESMCLGCIPVLPKEGGADKFAVSEKNSLIVNTMDNQEVYLKICELIDSPDKLVDMQKEGLNTGKGYNIINAAWSEAVMLNGLYDD